MNKLYERDEDLFAGMLDHCDRIILATKRIRSFEEYSRDWVLQDAIKMNLFQIGELANHVTEKRKMKLSAIPWKNMIGMRNIIAHGYISIDEKLLWETCVKDVPELKKKLEAAL